MAKLVVLIETDTMRGLGEHLDPFRTVKQWWKLDGTLVAEADEWMQSRFLQIHAKELAKER